MLAFEPIGGPIAGLSTNYYATGSSFVPRTTTGLFHASNRVWQASQRCTSYTEGIVALIQGTTLVNLIDSQSPSFNNQTSRTTSIVGESFLYNGSEYTQYKLSQPINGPRTLLVIGSVDTDGSNRILFGAADSGSSANVSEIYRAPNNWISYIEVGSGASSGNVMSANTSISLGDSFIAVARTVSTTSRKLSFRQLTSNTIHTVESNTSANISSVDSIVVGAERYNGVVSTYLTGKVFLAVLWNRALTDYEVQEVITNPWQLVQSRISPVPVSWNPDPVVQNPSISYGPYPTVERPSILRTVNTWSSQAQGLVGIDWANPVTQGLVALFDQQNGVEIISGARPINTSATLSSGPRGICRDFSGTANVRYTHQPSFAQTGAISIVVVCDIRSLTNYTALISKEVTTTTYVTYELRAGTTSTGSQISMVRSSAVDLSIYDTTQSDIISPTFSGTLIVTRSRGNIDAPTVVYSPKGRHATTGTRVDSSVFTVDNGADVWIGRRQDGVTQLDGRIYYIALYNRALLEDEAKSIIDNPWQLFASSKYAAYRPFPGPRRKLN